MTQASIGHQCPECVSDNKQQVYTVRNLPRTQAYVMVGLIAINVVVFLAQQATSGPAVLSSVGARGLLNGSQVADGEWYRICRDHLGSNRATGGPIAHCGRHEADWNRCSPCWRCPRALEWRDQAVRPSADERVVPLDRRHADRLARRL